MKIEITGNHCITCRFYSQYFTYNFDGLNPINCGYCGAKGKNTKPGNRCKEYHEQSNVYTKGVMK